MARETAGNRESDNNVAQKKDDGTLLLTLVRDFVENKSKKNDADFSAFFDRITSNDATKLDADITKELEIFKSKNEKFMGLNIEGVTYFDLQRETIKAGIGLKTRRDELEQVIKSLYDLGDPSNAVKLESEIKKLSKNKLDELLVSEVLRKDFLKKTFPARVPELKEEKKLFADIMGLNYDSLTESQREAAKNFYHTGLKDRQSLFELVNSITDYNQKKSLIQTFAPTITLAKLMDLGIIDQGKADDIIFDGLKSKFPNIKEERRGDFIEYIKKEDYVVSSSSFLSDPAHLNMIVADNKFAGLFDDVEKLEAKASEKQEAVKPRNKAEFIKKIKESGEFSNLSKLEIFGDNVILEGTNRKYDVEKNLYVKIERIHDNGTVDIRELSHESGILREADAPVQNISYDQLENILSYFIYDPSRGEFATDEQFKRKIEAGTLQEIPSEKDIKFLSDLIKRVDLEDGEGEKFGLKPGTVFTFEGGENGEEVSVCRILAVDEINKTVTVSNGAKPTYSFTEFLGAFIHQKAKRNAVINGTEELMNSLKEDKDAKDGFKDLVYIKEINKILPKNQEKNKEHPGVKYFVNKDKKALKIEEIRGNEIIVSTGEYTEGEKAGPDGKMVKNDKFAGNKPYSMSNEIFFAYMKKHKLSAKIFEDEVGITEPVNKKELSGGRSAGKWFFGMQNFLTISAGVKQWFTSIKDTLKENNDLQAAEFALSMGFMLPDSMRSDLQSRVESVQQKKMTEKITQLEKMNPGLVMKQVMKILKTRNSYQHELEAALMYIIKKHGILYPADLYEYKGSFLWYKKLGGRVGDALYTKYFKEQIQNGLPASEEGLIAELLSKQADKSSKYYPKRRTTIAQEFDSNYGTGRKVKDAGKDDNSGNVTRDGREAYCMDMLKKGRILYAIGALESTLEKGGNAVAKNKIPFMIAISGVTKKLHQDDAKKYGGLGAKYLNPMFSVCETPAKVDLFEKVVIKVAQKLKNADMEKDILSIKAMKENGTEELKILEASEEFWKKYSSILATKLLTNDNQMYLWSEEDPDIKEYFSYANMAARFHKNNFTGDAGGGNADSGVYDDDNSFLFLAGGAQYYLKQALSNPGKRPIQGGGPKKNFESLIKNLNKIKDDKNLDEAQKKKMFKKFNKEILIWLYESTTLTKDDLYALDWGKELIKTGLWIYGREERNSFEVKNIDDVYQRRLDDAYDKYKSGESKNFERVEKQKNEVILRVKDILNKKVTKKDVESQLRKKRDQSALADLISNYSNDDMDLAA